MKITISEIQSSHRNIIVTFIGIFSILAYARFYLNKNIYYTIIATFAGLILLLISFVYNINFYFIIKNSELKLNIFKKYQNIQYLFAIIQLTIFILVTLKLFEYFTLVK